MAGCSATPLAKKPGIREGTRPFVVHAPEGFLHTLEPLPAGVEVLLDAGATDVAIAFAKAAGDVLPQFTACIDRLEPDGGV